MHEIKVMQINVKKARTATKEIRQLAEDRRVDVICIQEPYIRNNKPQGFSVSSEKISIGDGPGAAIIIMNKNITTTTISQLSNPRVLCTEIKTSYISFILINMYFQYSHPIETYIAALEEIINNYPNQNLLILADSNAKSPLWNSKVTDNRGEQLEELILANNLTILNQPGNPPTFQNRAGASSNIDITLATPNLANYVRDWKVETCQTISDHNLITFSISLADDQIKDQEDQIKYNTNKLNWEKFKAKLVLPDITEGVNLETLTEELQEKVRNTIKQITKTSHKTKKHGGLPYWNNNLEKLKRLTRAKRRSYLAAKDPTIRQRRLANYQEQKNQYETELEKTRKECWERYIKQNVQLDPWGTPYKLVNQKIKTPNSLSTVKRKNGSMTKNWQETIETIMETLIPEDRVEEDLEEHRISRINAQLPARYPNMDTSGSIVTNEEIENILRGLKSNKAPGPDQIKA